MKTTFVIPASPPPDHRPPVGQPVFCCLTRFVKAALPDHETAVRLRISDNAKNIVLADDFHFTDPKIGNNQIRRSHDT